MQVQVSLTVDISASASVQQMEEQIIQAGREAMRQGLRASIRAWEEQHRRCPSCAQSDLRVEGSIRRRLGAVFGRVTLGLRRFRCQACLHRWCPAQGLLAVLDHKQMTVPLREAAVVAGASWPYRHAAHLLERLTGACISAEEIRQLTMSSGQQRAHRQQQEADATSVPSSEAASPCASGQQADRAARSVARSVRAQCGSGNSGVGDGGRPS